MYGAGAALCWAIGFVAARHGIDVGLSPLVIALHRYIWPGLALLPFIVANEFGDLGGIGWRHGIALALFGGLPLALLVLKVPLPARRVVGALAIVLGLCIIGAEALRTMGAQGVGGDLLFVAAGSFFAIFGMLVRKWRIAAMQAAAITSVLSLVGLPILLFRFDNLLAAGFFENLLQAVAQGALAGAGAIYFFTRAVVLLGASRAVLFPSLVSPFTLLVGFLALGEVPSISQLAGLVVVVVGFRLTQKG
jgi:drug/metabolite transporter (DMT)-like permease